MALTKATLIDLNSNELILDLDADTSITADTDDTIHIKIAGSDELTLTTTAIAPSTSDGQALGTSSLMFSDLFLASGSVLNFNNGDVTLTHASNLLTLDGGSLDLDGEALILDADGDTKLVESSDDVIHLTFAGSTSTPTEFGAGYMNLKNQGTRSYIRFYCESSNAHYTELRAAAHSDYSGNVQVTLPTTAGTLATLAGTETFTNKTLTSPNIGTSIELLARAEARFQDASGGQFVALEAPATVSSSFVLTLPAADGSSGQFLKTDGSGALSFDTVSSAADDLTTGDAAVTIATSSGNITIDAQAGDSDIIFKGTDGSSDTTFLTIDGSDAGTLIANHNLELGTDASEILFGADNEVKIIHNADKGLILKHTATADDKPVILTLQTGETDMAADDVIGKIEFQAPDEGTGTDAVLVAAAIQAVSEGDFSSSANATRIEFMVGASEAAAKKMLLTSAGKLEVDGGIDIEGGAVFNEDSASVDFRVESNGDANCLIVDGSADAVGIGTATPAAKLHVDRSAGSITEIRASAGTVYTKIISDDASGFSAIDFSNDLRFKDAGTERARFDTSGHYIPGADDTYDLGTSSKQWRNIYTGDLHLSNMTKETGNAVDGTKGDWTIQEGADDLFLINNNSGKKYKFNLTEIQ